MDEVEDLWGHCVCPLCFWEILKKQRCSDPSAATRIVMLPRKAFLKAAKDMQADTKPCPHRNVIGVT